MEVPTNISTSLHSQQLQDQYDQTSFNAIREPILRSETYLNEPAKKFIRFAFEQIQIARAAEALLNEKSEIKHTLRVIKCDDLGDELGDDHGVIVKDFFKQFCQINLFWGEAYKDCMRLDITSTIHSSFFSPKFTEIKLESTINGFLKNRYLAENTHQEIKNYILIIFKELQTLQRNAKFLDQTDFCYSVIVESFRDKKILNAIFLFFTKCLEMKVNEKKLDGYHADCTMTADIQNPCFFKPTTLKLAWTSFGGGLTRSKSFQLDEDKYTDDCRCILQ